MEIDGALHGGDSDRSGSIFTGIASSGRLGPVKVGSIFGAASDSPVQITAAGRLIVEQASDKRTLAGVTTAGDVSNAVIRAGYALDGAAVTPYVRIGTIKVGGEWNASSVLAGVAFGGDIAPAAGVLHAFDFVSNIAGITITGETRGTIATGDLFGFAARAIGSFKSNGDTLQLNKNLPDDLFVSNTSDVVVREVAAR